MAAASGPGTRLLVIVGDSALGRVLDGLLSGQQYAVEVVEDGWGGLRLGLGNDHDLVVVDRDAPGLSGIGLLHRLRAQAVTVPVLMLAGPGSVTERVRALDAGADDYLVKPFEPAELLARVRALHRRSYGYAALLPLGGGWLDAQLRLVRMPSGEQVPLSPRECRLLAALATRPKHVHTRDALRRHVFEGARAESIVDTYVYYLRTKLGSKVVRTIRGIGYRAGEL